MPDRQQAACARLFEETTAMVVRMKLFNVPNTLTISRIFLVPFILFFLYLGTKLTCLAAAALFVCAAVTDLFDGYLARRDNQITIFGKFLDPLADKVLVSSVLVMLVGLDWVSSWIAIIIICRDIMVNGLRAIAADEGIVIAADVFGKAKTIVQLIALVPLVLHYTWLGLDMHRIGTFLLYIALALTIFSGWNYFSNFFRHWKAAEGNNAPSTPGDNT